MKRGTLSLLLAFMAVLLLCAGCGRGQNGTNSEAAEPEETLEETEVTESTVITEPSGLSGKPEREAAQEPSEPIDLSAPDDTVDGLPPVPDGVPADAISDYVLEQYGDWFDGEVILCSPLIYKTDYSNPEDVQVWGYFWMTAYEPEGTVMVTSGAGGPAGLFHLKTTDSGYEVQSFDMLPDGGDYEAGVRRICGGDTELEAKFMTTDPMAVQEAQVASLRTYAARNGVTLTSYREPDGTEVFFG